MNDAAVIAKFRGNVARVLAEPAVDRLQATVLTIGTAGDARGLFRDTAAA